MGYTATVTTETETITSGRAEETVGEISMGRVEENIAPIGRKSYFEED
jgi:hypothetical protein